jgi:hypothetical protein
MIFFCLLLMILNCNGLPFDYKLKNKDFSVNINSNGIKLDNNYNIYYEKFTQANKIKKINFNDFEYNKEYSFTSVSSKMDNINFLYEMTENNTKFINSMKRVSKYEDDKLYVSIYIDNWTFNNKNNELDFVLSIDSNNNILNNNSIYINNEFNIEFDENCIVDGYDETIYLTKINNKFKIHFPSFQHHLYYQFIISKTNSNHNHFNLFIISILCIGLIFGYKYYKYDF